LSLAAFSTSDAGEGLGVGTGLAPSQGQRFFPPASSRDRSENELSGSDLV